MEVVPDAAEMMLISRLVTPVVSRRSGRFWLASRNFCRRSRSGGFVVLSAVVLAFSLDVAMVTKPAGVFVNRIEIGFR